MSKSDPGKMRQQVTQLVGKASNTDDIVMKRKLTSRAFALAQDAEAVERSSEDSAERDAQVTVYRCYFRDKAGARMGWKLIRCDSDFCARKSAMALLRERSEISQVEVWRESDLAFRLSRFDLAVRQH